MSDLIEVNMLRLPFEVQRNGYTYRFGFLRNNPDMCTIEIKKGNEYVYANHLENIRNSDRLTIYPNDEFPKVPVSNLIFYYR
jgi:hypothetical protein